MKLVSDFDGVLTELSHEAARVREIFVSGLGAYGREHLADTERAMLAAPERAGWEVRGRISAFADEDSFIHTNALGAWLDGLIAHDPKVARVLEDMRSLGHADFKAAGEAAHDQMVKEVMSGQGSPIDPATSEVLGGLIAGGHQVTVISNSGSSRIADIFAKARIDCTTFPEKEPNRICVRGGARKFELAEAAEWLACGARQVDVARPIYRQMMREEKPDAVLGDVFSLDLAAPLALACAEPALFPNGLKLILRVRPYTPAWSREMGRQIRDIARGAPVSFHLLENLRDLPSVLNIPIDPRTGVA